MVFSEKKEISLQGNMSDNKNTGWNWQNEIKGNCEGGVLKYKWCQLSK